MHHKLVAQLSQSKLLHTLKVGIQIRTEGTCDILCCIINTETKTCPLSTLPNKKHHNFSTF